MDASSASKRAVGLSHISVLPDELLSQVLTLLPFATKAALHRVCKRWNRILRHPVIPHVYGDCELDLTASSLTPLRERELWRIADWLARRAYGIQLLLINSGPWRGISGDVTESGFFYAQQLPYLMGQLRHKEVQLKVSFWSTGLCQADQCILTKRLPNPCMLRADLDLMSDALVSEDLLRSYLKDNLLELSLKKYHEDATSYGTLDVLCDLTSLQTLHIRPFHMEDQWEVTSRLSQLQRLQSFHFQRGILSGSLVAAFGNLPALTELKTTCVPDGNLSLDSSQFTSLKTLTKSSGALYDTDPEPFVLQLPALTAHTALTRGQCFGLLRKLSLHDCIFETAPPHLQALACLKKVKFKNCRFQPEQWLEEALEGAVQIERMTIVECELLHVPVSLCHLVNLKNLTLASNLLLHLPVEFSQLTALKFLGLYNNQWVQIPEVLEHMVHLQEISLAYSLRTMSILRPLTFLLQFHSLLAFNIGQGGDPYWDSVSMYHIGELVAAFENNYVALGRRKPEFLW